MSSTTVLETKTDVKHRTSIPEKPITEERTPLIPTNGSDKHGLAANYAVPRANIAATKDAPNGTVKDQYGYRNRKKTVGFTTEMSFLKVTDEYRSSNNIVNSSTRTMMV